MIGNNWYNHIHAMGARGTSLHKLFSSKTFDLKANNDSLWEEMRAMVHRLYFVSMEALWEFLAGDFDYEPPPR